jgi:1,4-dihydroxy-2-naphthoate octaprenyltransferase
MTMHPRRSEAILAGFARDVRAGEWWTFKIVPILAIFYLTALREGGAIIARWPTLLLLLGGLAAGAAFVSLINDLCDITDDRVAGKPNRMAGRRRIVPILGIALCIAAGTVIGFQWRNDAVALTAFAAAWFAFLLYSAPPFRLKIRGGAGLLADAAGSSLFPCLLAARLAGASDLLWLLCVGIWAFAFGIRGIVWHQLNDEDADRRANVRTFVVRRGRACAVKLVHFAIVPAEAMALAGLAILGDALAVAIAALAYATMVALHCEYFWQTPTLVVPGDRPLFIGQLFYDLLLPCSLLVAAAARHSSDALLLATHLVVFAPASIAFCGNVGRLWQCHRARVQPRG